MATNNLKKNRRVSTKILILMTENSKSLSLIEEQLAAWSSDPNPNEASTIQLDFYLLKIVICKNKEPLPDNILSNMLNRAFSIALNPSSSPKKVLYSLNFTLKIFEKSTQKQMQLLLEKESVLSHLFTLIGIWLHDNNLLYLGLKILKNLIEYLEETGCNSRDFGFDQGEFDFSVFQINESEMNTIFKKIQKKAKIVSDLGNDLENRLNNVFN